MAYNRPYNPDELPRCVAVPPPSCVPETHMLIQGVLKQVRRARAKTSLACPSFTVRAQPKTYTTTPQPTTPQRLVVRTSLAAPVAAGTSQTSVQ